MKLAKPITYAVDKLVQYHTHTPAVQLPCYSTHVPAQVMSTVALSPSAASAAQVTVVEPEAVE